MEQMEQITLTINGKEVTLPVLRFQISSRGGGIEVELSPAGWPDVRMNAYQNYLGGGLLGKVCTNCTIRDWNTVPELAEIGMALRQAFHDITNPDPDEWESVSKDNQFEHLSHEEQTEKLAWDGTVSTPQHTPGPWKQEYQTYEDGAHTCVANQDGDWIADCGKESNPESEANARLIAAAPELLEALKEAQKLLHPLVMKMKIKDHFHEHNVLANVIVKAIEKAEGRDVA